MIPFSGLWGCFFVVVVVFYYYFIIITILNKTIDIRKENTLTK